MPYEEPDEIKAAPPEVFLTSYTEIDTDLVPQNDYVEIMVNEGPSVDPEYARLIEKIKQSKPTAAFLARCYINPDYGPESVSGNGHRKEGQQIMQYTFRWALQEAKVFDEAYRRGTIKKSR